MSDTTPEEWLGAPEQSTDYPTGVLVVPTYADAVEARRRLTRAVPGARWRGPGIVEHAGRAVVIVYRSDPDVGCRRVAGRRVVAAWGLAGSSRVDDEVRVRWHRTLRGA